MQRRCRLRLFSIMVIRLVLYFSAIVSFPTWSECNCTSGSRRVGTATLESCKLCTDRPTNADTIVRRTISPIVGGQLGQGQNNKQTKHQTSSLPISKLHF